MTHCFHGDNPAACIYHPDCSRGRVLEYALDTGDRLEPDLGGPFVVHVYNGECEVECNGRPTQVAAPEFLLVPHRKTVVRAAEPSTVYIFAPGIVRLLADSLGVDFFQTRKPDRHVLRPVTLFDDQTAAAHSRALAPAFMYCRHYADHKFAEMIYTVDPALHPAIRRALMSKDWFFREKAGDLASSCRTAEEFAWVFGMSVSGFSKRFTRLFGISFYRWYQQRRLAGLLRDLKHTDLTLRELTIKYGFYSVQHLGHFVKTQTGLTPGKVRERARG